MFGVIVSFIVSVSFIFTPIVRGELIKINSLAIAFSLCVLILIMINFYLRGYKLTFLLIFIIIASFLYFYTYQKQYDLPQYGYNIDSMVYIEKSENFTFDWFRQDLIFIDKKHVVLKQKLYMSNSFPLKTHIRFVVPHNATFINITVLTEPITTTQKSVLLYLDAYNVSKGYKVSFPAGFPVIEMTYILENVEPRSLVRFWIYGKNSKPTIKDLESYVVFNRFKYQCSNPCISLRDKRGYYYAHEELVRYLNDSKVIPAYVFHIKLENSSEIVYFIDT